MKQSAETEEQKRERVAKVEKFIRDYDRSLDNFYDILALEEETLP